MFCGSNVVAVVVFLFLRNYLLMVSEISKGIFDIFKLFSHPPLNVFEFTQACNTRDLVTELIMSTKVELESEIRTSFS